MAKKKLSEEQKLRNRLVQNVNSRRNFLNREGFRDAKNAFLEKFILCEIAIKIILTNYYKNIGEEKKVESVEMGLTTIKAALKLAGYAPDDDMLNKMFLAKRARGQRSARDLRNGIVHDLSVNDIQEVVNRREELNQLLDGFFAFLVNPTV